MHWFPGKGYLVISSGAITQRMKIGFMCSFLFPGANDICGYMSMIIVYLYFYGSKHSQSWMHMIKLTQNSRYRQKRLSYSPRALHHSGLSLPVLHRAIKIFIFSKIIWDENKYLSSADSFLQCPPVDWMRPRLSSGLPCWTPRVYCYEMRYLTGNGSWNCSWV